MIYISGQITDRKNYRDVFNAAEQYLIETQNKHSIYGTSKIINPAKVSDALPQMEYREYLDVAFYLLSMCDMIYMLKGWEKSPGARAEHEYASATGMRIIYSRKF